MKKSFAQKQNLVFLVLLLVVSCPLQAGIGLVAIGRIPGNLTDKSGLTTVLTSSSTDSKGRTCPDNAFGSFGSAIDYTGKGNRYIVLNDRGFGDGTADSKCRFHEIDLEIDEKAGIIKSVLVSTTLLRNPNDDIYTGLATSFSKDIPQASLRFDPEGIRISETGTLFISDEYGPWIREFTQDGKLVRSLNVPDKFTVSHLFADSKQETLANRSGRQGNRGMEGLAISPDKTTLYGIMQSPLIQDGSIKVKADSDGNRDFKRIGLNIRILRLDIRSGNTQEFVYQLESEKYGVNEILAINSREFLVLERDGKSGKDAEFKRIYRIDISGASDISDIGKTPENGLPSGRDLPEEIVPVKKTLFIDLLDKAFNINPQDIPEKLEGMTWGPTMDDGRALLLITSDNDLLTDKPTIIYAFAIDPNQLITPAK